MDTPLFFSNAETCDSSRKLAEENYQRELLLHAEDTKRVVLTSEELEKVKKERNEAERKATSVATEFAESARSWETSKSMLVREREEGEERMKDMSVQNNLLHAQLENVTTKVQQLEEPRGTDRRNILESSLVVPSNSDSNGDDAATDFFGNLIVVPKKVVSKKKDDGKNGNGDGSRSSGRGSLSGNEKRRQRRGKGGKGGKGKSGRRQPKRPTEAKKISGKQSPIQMRSKK